MQVALNQAYSEKLNSVSDVLSTTIEDQSSLRKEVCPMHLFSFVTIPKSHNLPDATEDNMSRKNLICQSTNKHQQCFVLNHFDL